MKPSFLKKLDQRKIASNYRSLTTIPTDGIDFFSNDYLGISKDFDQLGLTVLPFCGSTGSRLLSGNSREAVECEQFIAQKFRSQSALIFNSGYDANLGFFSSILQKGDTVIYDEFIHASIRDGIRLSLAKAFSFKHNDIADLERKIKQADGTIYIAIESIYSMNGDFAPLIEITEICQQKACYVIVDEAHATGIYGENGEGLVVHLGLEEKVFARIITFSKAYGFFGAAVLASTEVIDFLVNFARSFIYSTALSPTYYTLLLQLLSLDLRIRKEQLMTNIKLWKKGNDLSPIHIVHFDSVSTLNNVSRKLSKQGIFQKPIYAPTVPIGNECIRICFHAFNTADQVAVLHATLKSV